MRAYVLRRIASLVPLWIGLSLFTFALGTLAPGDPARALAALAYGPYPTPEQVETVRREEGLDRPAPVRYAVWLAGAARADFGRSLRTGLPSGRSVGAAFPVTLRLTLAAFLLAVALAVPAGILSALRRGRMADHATRVLALAAASLPSFWFGYLLIVAFALGLDLLPSQGAGGPAGYVLPAVTLALGSAGVLLRLTRASMLEVLGEEFVLTARARGLPPSIVIYRHALRAALNPLLSYAGLLLGGLLGGAVIVETVFGLPGLGRLVVDAIRDRDTPVVQGFVLYLGTVVLLVNLAVDLAYVAADPRVRLTAGGRHAG